MTKQKEYKIEIAGTDKKGVRVLSHNPIEWDGDIHDAIVSIKHQIETNLGWTDLEVVDVDPGDDYYIDVLPQVSAALAASAEGLKPGWQTGPDGEMSDAYKKMLDQLVEQFGHGAVRTFMNRMRDFVAAGGTSTVHGALCGAGGTNTRRFVATVQFEVPHGWFRDDDDETAFHRFVVDECNLVHLGGDYDVPDGEEPRDEVEGVIVSCKEFAFEEVTDE